MLGSAQPSCPGEEAKVRQRQGIYTGARRTLSKDKIPDTNWASVNQAKIRFCGQTPWFSLEV